MNDEPKFTGFWFGGTFFPPGLFKFSHDTDLGPVFVPNLPEMTPDPGAFSAMLSRVESPWPKVDWLA